MSTPNNNLRQGFKVTELEDRLETVQLAAASGVNSDRCDRCNCDDKEVAAE